MTAASYRNLSELLSTSVERYGANPFLGVRLGENSWKWMTYSEFGQTVDNARAGLSSLGVEAGDRVAIISNNGIPWAVAAYATYTLGGVFVPMYEAQQDKDWRYIIGNCGAKVLLVANEEILERVEGFRDEIPSVEHIVTIAGETDLSFATLLAEGEQTTVAPVFPDSDDVAGLIYTSGTTGEPKGVVLSHGNLTSNIAAINEAFPLEPNDRSASFLPWAHAFGQTVELHTLLSLGASTGMTGPKTLVRDMPELKPTILVAVPTMFNRMYDAISKLVSGQGGLVEWVFGKAMANAMRRQDMRSQGFTTKWVELLHSLFDNVIFSKIRGGMGGRLKFAFTGGAAISTEVTNFISAMGITVYEGYGLSETSPVVSANTRRARKLATVGKPVPGVTVKIDTKLSEDPGVGEIVIYGPNVMQGYYGLPEKTAEVMTEDGGFRTGDLGSLDDEGFLSIRGRIKEQYKLENGKYVVPTPIEAQLELSGYIQNVMIYGEQRPYNIAIIVPDMVAVNMWAEKQGLETADREVLIATDQVTSLFTAELERQSGPVKHYERPRGFVLESEEWTPENGFLTPSLKVKRRAVVAAFSDQIEDLYPG